MFLAGIHLCLIYPMALTWMPAGAGMATFHFTFESFETFSVRYRFIINPTQASNNLLLVFAGVPNKLGSQKGGEILCRPTMGFRAAGS
jgi:hypothetical protein